MRSKPVVLNILLIGILLSSIAYSTLILDFTLVPRLIVMSTTAFICFLFILKAKEQISLNADLILISYVSFVLWSCLSSFWANTLSEAIFENSKLIIAFLTFLLGCYALKKDNVYIVIMLCKLSVLIILIESVLVAIQLSHLNIYNKEVLYTVFGANSHKNLLSSFLFIQLFFLVIGSIRLKKIWRYLSMICLLLAVFMIVIIQTKAVWIALCISSVLAGICVIYGCLRFNFSFKWILIIKMLLANVFFVFIQPKVIESGLAFNKSQIQQANQFSGKTELDNERLELWNKTYYMIHHSPLAGVGCGNWQIYFPDAGLNGMYRAEDLNFTFQRPHNDLLWIVSETGFIGLNLFLLFVFSILLLILKSIRFLVDQKKPVFELILCFIVIIGFFTASFFDFPKERIEHLIWINLIFAFAYHHSKDHYYLKKITTLKINTFYKLTAIIITCGICIISIYRYKGEYYTRKMYDQKRLSNPGGVIREAKKALSIIYTIDPTSLPIKWYTGNSYALLGNFQQSKNDLLEAYKLNPYNRNVLNDLGSAYVNTNQISLAQNYYLEACRISPRFDDSKLNLTALYFNQKQFQKADSVLKTLHHDSERRTKYQTMVNAFLGKK
jgi:O-antigen ligase